MGLKEDMLSENIDAVQKKISEAAGRAGRDPSGVKLLAVSKTVPVARLREAISYGLKLFGENYVQEARAKIKEVGPGVSWHFIGRLQTNKAKYAVRLFDLIHSLDNEELAIELNRRAAAVPRIMPVLIEVNLSGEENKGGIAPDTLLPFLEKVAVLPNLSVRGLMTMPPFFADPEKARPYFRHLKDLGEEIRVRNIPNIRLEELSMGMTGDFEVAVEEGATIVRIGTALFGPRG
ncbi:MAG: YggS family pyridoxal phosphate-dependent enzyme [Deltaproteobacteria bacterium]|nr:YggS family pyridoxal phosphate-dependent enzyme [Deltaproteobacteria bacterium]